MIAGLDWTAWLLAVAAIGLGLAVELRFFLAQRRRRTSSRRAREERSGR